MDSLKNIIIQSKNGDKDCMLLMIQKFMPLIKKYSNKLSYDDAREDLIIGFMEIIGDMPVDKSIKFDEEKYIVGYINISMKHLYVKLLKKLIKLSDNETGLYLNTMLENDNVDTSEFINNRIILKELLNKISAYQRYIIISIYFLDLSEDQIAKNLKVSRQAINRTKLRALKSLKEMLLNDGVDFIGK
ncbi:sigma-70 family RNA polymerase sigma factor [Clostridium felsineum]|uniref:sigma-70 family RNA polymerase sigma factor n=1 Tax=Clostridium felsineum TaxID=36839 RepID=UPI00098C54EC|nr:sigma-70 family RNA polymerase sigma factor [Clostridium felsineum]URZ17343.1 Bacteriocin UviA [Clostridium felsineum DSM 794]